ncbi:conserved hypothetical protein [Histoplasma capsulatum var. duboisii H88]|uniref:Uncharacterized protein n=2 Tax=Ajellomyces capsulatus TaxID=5037 RepID=F0UAZ5_AJEC8|nr:conserved hypothetical protein [Histoplasma capsulatum H143]EGC42958.1 conserved hypothetical protein [Histoplasma capsulatum var. duboisii H88]
MTGAKSELFSQETGHNAPYIDDEAGLRVHERSNAAWPGWYQIVSGGCTQPGVPGLGCDTVTYGPFPHTGLIRAGQGYQVPCSASLAPGTGYGGKYRT